MTPGGMLPLSLERRRQLEELFVGWRSPPADPAGLAEAIDRACAYSELFREEEATDLTAGELRSELSRYRDTLAKARRLCSGLPQNVVDAMQSNAMAYRGALPPELIRQLALVEPVELLLLLESLSDTYLEHHTPRPGERQKFYIWLVREIAQACREHGVTVGSSDRGHFHQIIEVAIPAVEDHRDLIRRALVGGETGKNI